MTVKVSQPTLDNFHAKVVPSIHHGRTSKVQVVLNQQGVPATYNGLTEPSFADRQQQFDSAVANQPGSKLSEISESHTVIGDKIYSTATGELLGEYGPSDVVLQPRVRNAAVSGQRVGTPSLRKLEPTHEIGSLTTAIPAHVVEPEPAVAPSETSAVARRIRKLEAALDGLVAEINDLKNTEEDSNDD